MTQTRSGWYDSKVVVIVFLIVFFPVGLYGLWKTDQFTSKTKWILLGVVVLVYFAVGTQEPADQQITAAPPDTPSEEGTPQSQEPEGEQGVDAVSSRSDSTASNDLRIDGDNRTGCSDREYYEKLTLYAVQKDYAAFNRSLTTGFISGICVKFTAGEQVFIVDSAIFSGLVKIRRKGETAEYWTAMEATNR